MEAMLVGLRPSGPSNASKLPPSSSASPNTNTGVQFRSGAPFCLEAHKPAAVIELEFGLGMFSLQPGSRIEPAPWKSSGTHRIDHGNVGHIQYPDGPWCPRVAVCCEVVGKRDHLSGVGTKRVIVHADALSALVIRIAWSVEKSELVIVGAVVVHHPIIRYAIRISAPSLRVQHIHDLVGAERTRR